MVRRKSDQATILDTQLTKAALDVQTGVFRSAYAAAKAYGLRPEPVRQRVNGGLSRLQARHKQQKLSSIQEKTLLKWIKQLTISGYAISHRLLREIAEEIRAYRTYNLDDATRLMLSDIPLQPAYKLGQAWVARFVQRHSHLKSIIGRRIEAIRMDGVSKPILDAWFDAYKSIISEHKIKQYNVYNMDESGFSIGTMESTRIILDSSIQTRYQAHPGRQEWVSMIECICADGTSISPLGIFKGINVLQSWIPDSIINKWFFTTNTKGWTSNLHGLEWLKRVFEPITRSKADGQYRLLIYDSHDSHISGSFIAHCLQNRILLFILPPHTSHILQPLDVAIFGPLKKRLTAALQHLNQAQLLRIQKREWLEAYNQARLDVLTPQNIESAWRGAGLFPLNPHRAFRTLTPPLTSTPTQPKTPTDYKIFDQVWISSSPPDISSLQTANQLLSSTISSCTAINTPVRQYVQKLITGSEALHTSNTINKHDATNLRSVLQKRKNHSKGKRAILKGHFHITTQKIHAEVVEAENETKKRAQKSRKKSSEKAFEEFHIDSEDEEDIQDEDYNNEEDCITVSC